jgi:hypothetical protein
VPFRYTRRDADRIIVLTAEGEITLDHWRAAITRQIREGCWAYGVLYDAGGRTNVRTASEVETVVDEVRRLIDRYGARGPVAYVALELAEYGMGRMYGTMSNRLEFDYGTFSDVAEAERWLLDRLRDQR